MPATAAPGAGALLLPRALLLRALRCDEAETDIAARNEVTSKMLIFRPNATGARMQVARGRSGASRRPSA